jgi:hypothetical protein
MNDLPSHHPTAITPSELDRLHGRTHLVINANNKDANQSAPSDSVTHTYTSIPMSEDKKHLDHLSANENSLHPIITQDMRSFDMNTEEMFDPSIFDFPMSSESSSFPVPDFHGLGGYASNPHSMISGTIPPHLSMNFVPQQHVDQYMTVSSMTDTWENFVGQLGL